MLQNQALTFNGFCVAFLRGGYGKLLLHEVSISVSMRLRLLTSFLLCLVRLGRADLRADMHLDTIW